MLKETILKLQEQDFQLVTVVTGGGAELLSELTRYGGASKFLLDASAPWNQAALMKYLQARKAPDQFCSETTARTMAVAAYWHGVNLGGDPAKVIGLSLTAKLGLTTKAEREGREHAIYCGLQTYDSTDALGIKLHHPRSREGESELSANLALKMLCYGLDIPSFGLLQTPEEPCFMHHSKGTQAIVDVAHGKTDFQIVHAFDPNVKIENVFSSSMNPLTKNHIEMIRRGHEETGKPVFLELAIRNADKPPLDYMTVNERIELTCSRIKSAILDGTLAPGVFGGIVLTNKATFLEKAKIFKGATFLIGGDTYNRIVDPIYYGGNQDSMQAAIQELTMANARFLVFDRKDVELSSNCGKFNELCKTVAGYQDNGHSSTKERYDSRT
jgi:hypothetical protein